MKEIKEIWERHLRESKQEKNRHIEEFKSAVKPGMIRMFRYSTRGEATGAATIDVDPHFFTQTKSRSSYSKREWNTSGFPRSFWYADPEDKEHIVSGKLYYYDVPEGSIYDLKKDPEDIVQNSRHPTYRYMDWEKFFRDVSEKYDGVFYTLGRSGQPVVAYFKSVEALAVETQG